MKAVTSNQQVPRATQSAECEQYVDGEYFCQKYFLYTSYLVVPSYMINKSHGALNKMWGKIMKKNICRPSLSCCIAFVEALVWLHSYYIDHSEGFQLNIILIRVILLLVMNVFLFFINWLQFYETTCTCHYLDWYINLEMITWTHMCQIKHVFVCITHKIKRMMMKSKS